MPKHSNKCFAKIKWTDSILQASPCSCGLVIVREVVQRAIVENKIVKQIPTGKVRFTGFDPNSKILGQGSTGNVYQAYELDTKGNIIGDGFVAKVMRTDNLFKPPSGFHQLNREQQRQLKKDETKAKYLTRKEEFRNEAYFLNKKSCPVFAVFSMKMDEHDELPNTVIIEKNIRGSDLTNDDELLNAFIQQLPLLKRLEILASTAISFMLVHQETYRTGKRVIHKDIKGANIRFEACLRKAGCRDIFVPVSNAVDDPDFAYKLEDYYQNGYQLVFNVYPIDFGYSQALNDDQAAKIFPAGTPVYIAPEVTKSDGGVKSDVYSFTALYLMLLGVENPIEGKENDQGRNDVTKIPFTMTNLGIDFPRIRLRGREYRAELLVAIKRMGSMMQDLGYKKRPNMEVVSQFCNKLLLFMKTYYLLNEKNSSLTYVQKIELEARLLSYLKELNTLAIPFDAFFDVYHKERKNNEYLDDTRIRLAKAVADEEYFKQLPQEKSLEEIKDCFKRIPLHTSKMEKQKVIQESAKKLQAWMFYLDVSEKLKLLHEAYEIVKKPQQGFKKALSIFFNNNISIEQKNQIRVLKACYYEILRDALLDKRLSSADKDAVIALYKAHHGNGAGIIDYHWNDLFGETNTRKSLNRFLNHVHQNDLMSGKNRSA